MRRTNVSHFSHVLAAVQRTGSLPGGEIRGLPNGRSIDGLQGIHTFSMELAEVQKEFQLGRIRSALDRAKQLEVQFHGVANRWDSAVFTLLNDIRQGKHLKNLEKLKELKAAQLRMQQLVSPARKAFQDLVTALDHDSIANVRESNQEKWVSQSNAVASRSRLSEVEPTKLAENPSVDASTTPISESPPDAGALGSFAANYNFGPKLRLRKDTDHNVRIEPRIEPGKFYYLAGLERPRVIRIRKIDTASIHFFDTLSSEEVTLTTEEISMLVEQGVWLLANTRSSVRDER